MATKTTERVKTFSIGFADKRFDELRFARMVVERNRTEHREQVVTPSIHEVLETLADYFDEPFGDSSAIPMLYLSRMTRQHVTVALCGDGADELFGGYRRYYFGVLEERIRRRFPDWFRQSVIKIGARYYPKFDYLPQIFRAKTLLNNLSQQLGDAYFTTMSVFRDGELEALLSPEIRKAISGYSPRESFRKRFKAVSHLPPLEQMQFVDFQTWLPGDILVKADRATMAYSLEVRSPWLDYRLVDLACQLPFWYKLRGNIGKYIFKMAMVPYVPSQVVVRKKMGFSVPLAAWFRTSLKSIFQSLVLRSEMGTFCSLAEIRKLWDEHQSGLRNHERKLWNLLMLASWDVQNRKFSHSHVLAELAQEAG